VSANDRIAEDEFFSIILAVGIDLEPGLSPSAYQPADASMAGGDCLKCNND
jgi:hypothetical protein